jgi:capsular polysaccharide biosynthesis protein
MRRYIDTFFRYWLIAVLPIIVIPTAAYMIVRHTPPKIMAVANVWVDQNPPGYDNQFMTPAQNEASNFNEFVQSRSFDSDVIKGVPAFQQMLAKGVSMDVLISNLTKNLLITAGGEAGTATHLINLSYTGASADEASGVLQSFLSTVHKQEVARTSSETQTSIYLLSYQLKTATQNLAQATQSYRDYLTRHGYQPSDIQNAQSSDPNVATLLQQVTVAQQTVTDDRQQLSKLKAQLNVPPSIAQQGSFTIKDMPSVLYTSNTKTKLMDLAIAIVVALILGLGFVVVRTALDSSVRFVDEVPHLLGLPVLTVVPYDNTQTKRPTRKRQETAAAVPSAPLPDAVGVE